MPLVRPPAYLHRSLTLRLDCLHHDGSVVHRWSPRLLDELSLERQSNVLRAGLRARLLQGGLLGESPGDAALRVQHVVRRTWSLKDIPRLLYSECNLKIY